MTDSPQFTVALPTCNGSRHLADALRSILGQSDVAFDLLVSDDCSDDDTLTIVRDLAGDRARVSINSERLGLAGNWNRAITLAQTPWVALFHQDDVMQPGHLAAHQAAAATHPDLGLIASATSVIDDAGRAIPPTRIDPGGCGSVNRMFSLGEFLAELLERNPLRCSGVTTASDAHQAVGGFDPRLRYVVDWDFWARVARIRPVAWLARPTVAIRWHDRSETHQFREGTADLDETAQLLDTLHAEAGPGSIVQRRRADRRLARAWLNRAYTASKADRPELARFSLKRAVQTDPVIVATIVADPRLLWRLVVGTHPSRRSRPDR